MRSTILLLKIFRKTNLVILEAAKIIFALILNLITQKYTDIEVCKFLFQPLLCTISLFTFTFSTFSHTLYSTFSFFFYGVKSTNIRTSTKATIQKLTIYNYSILQFYSKVYGYSASEGLRFDRNLPANNSAIPLQCVFPISIHGRLKSDSRALSQKVSSNSKHDEIDSGSVKKFPSESQLSKYPCIGSLTDDKSTLVTPTLLDPSETSSNVGETWPKQRQHNLNKFQVYSIRDNSGHEERKETMSSTAGPTSNSPRYTCLTSSTNSV